MHRTPVTTSPQAIRTAATVGMSAIVGGLVYLALSAPADVAQAPIAPPTVSVPSAAPVTIPGHAVPGVRMVADSPAAPSSSVPAPATTAPRKAAPVVKAPAKVPAAPRTQTQNRGTYTVSCTNGYLHSDGSCSSTPEQKDFNAPIPPGLACGAYCGTAAQGFDQTMPGLGCNEIAGMLGSGTPGCVDPVTP
jgi:hypothetical protein